MKENLKAVRSAAELQFMLSQISLNLDFIDSRDAASLEQEIVTLNHDIQVLAHRAGIVNAEIMKFYSKNHEK